MNPSYRLALTASIAVFFAACSKPTEAENAEKKREELRIKKRENAVKYYKQLANEFVDHEKSEQALQRARALEAGGKK